MAYTAPKTWSYKETLSANDLNIYVRDNILALKALIDAIYYAGMIMMYGGPTAPTGWMLCDGSAVSRTTYASLFLSISTAFGVGNGTTTFNLPSFVGRVPVGVSAGETEFALMGSSGGSKYFDINHLHHIYGQTGNCNNDQHRSGDEHSDAADKNHSHLNDFYSQAMDRDATRSAIQPYQCVNFIIKT